MRAFISAIAVFFVTLLPVQANDADVQATISNQIEAFKVDDFERAFTYASPNIQRIFQSPQRFGTMVAQGYPMVHRPATVEFKALRSQSDALYQAVQIRDQNGVFFLLDYRMIMVGSDWRIDGVQLLKAPEYGA